MSMKILLTGANGYIGLRLLPELLNQGHQLICAVRNKDRISSIDQETRDRVEIVEIDFLEPFLPPAVILVTLQTLVLFGLRFTPC